MTPEQIHIEYIKIVVSIITPLTIVIIGFILNRSIKEKNAFEEKKQSLRIKWADDFSLEANHLNKGITNFIMVFHKNRAKLIHNKTLVVNSSHNPQLEIIEQHLELQRSQHLINKFYPYAPKNGDTLKKTIDDMLYLAGIWGTNNGGNPKDFIDSQDRVNSAVYKVHAELLEAHDDAKQITQE